MTKNPGLFKSCKFLPWDFIQGFAAQLVPMAPLRAHSELGAFLPFYVSVQQVQDLPGGDRSSQSQINSLNYEAILYPAVLSGSDKLLL